jgi:hypothetical protein
MDDMPELLRLLPALAALASKEVKVSIDMPAAVLGASAVQQMGGALGSSLKQVVLRGCGLSPDFWPAVWAHLPGLQQLTVGDKVHGAIGVHEVAAFCSHATRPLQLNLRQDLHKEMGGKLEEQCQVWGVPQVTVTVTEAGEAVGP